MNIYLYHIKGINTVDTLYFATLSSQLSYFDSKKAKVIQDAYYPPLYHNTIRLTRDDVDFDNIHAMNYLSFMYQLKMYYYFIRDIRYVSNDVIEIDIEMDTIQTFYFNLDIISGVVERKFINRYVYDDTEQKWYFNRDYIRENISAGNFMLNSYDSVYETTDNSKFFIVGRFTRTSKIPPGGTVQPVGTTTSWLCVEKTTIPTALNLVPNTFMSDVGDTRLFAHSAIYLNYVDSQHYDIMAGGSAITAMMTLEELYDAYICPFNPFYNIKFETNPLGINMPYITHVGYDYSYLNYNDMHGETINYLQPTANYNIKIKTWEIDLTDFCKGRNTNVSSTADYRYEPCIIDDNYMRVDFGSISTYTNYPLHFITRPYVYGHYYFNISDGSRVYYMNEYGSVIDNEFDATLTFEDNHRTLVVDNNILTLSKLKTAENAYISQNYNRWAQITFNSTQSALSNYTSSVSRISSNNKDIELALDELQDSRMTNRQIGRAKRQVQSLRNDNYVSGATFIAKTASNTIGSVVNQLYEENNLMHTPAKVQSQGNNSGIILKEAVIWHRLYTVNDIKQVGLWYQRNGYKVNDYILEPTMFTVLLNNVNTRYYFNILKCSNLTIDLERYIDSENINDDIIDRLSLGIRVWNRINNGTEEDFFIGDYRYDNVEKDYL